MNYYPWLHIKFRMLFAILSSIGCFFAPDFFIEVTSSPSISLFFLFFVDSLHWCFKVSLFRKSRAQLSMYSYVEEKSETEWRIMYNSNSLLAISFEWWRAEQQKFEFVFKIWAQNAHVQLTFNKIICCCCIVHYNSNLLKLLHWKWTNNNLWHISHDGGFRRISWTSIDHFYSNFLHPIRFWYQKSPSDLIYTYSFLFFNLFCHFIQICVVERKHNDRVHNTIGIYIQQNWAQRIRIKCIENERVFAAHNARRKG